MVISKNLVKKINPEQLFMLSVLLVNGGNYLYNLILGRVLGPEKFADAAILITFLLVLSFVAMTYQLVTAKFIGLFDNKLFTYILQKIYKNASGVGVALGILIIVFSEQLQTIFNTSSAWMFVIFGIGVPCYFLMSVNRGLYQGTKAYKPLSITYQGEMLSRLILTLLLLSVLKIDTAMIISLGIIGSFVFGLFPLKKIQFSTSSSFIVDKNKIQQVKVFFVVTAFYELSQIIINNSDILLVKHFFASYEAGLYASLALIGRLVYFIAWMFVMLLLPSVVSLKKQGKDTTPILFKYASYITGISFIIVMACVICPELIINILFGKAYISIAPYLWQYALATSLFALANIFAYYYLSLSKYIPVIISAILGALQVVLIYFFHKNLEQVIHMQLIAMVILLTIQVGYFLVENRKVFND